jgi:hypothetical protein
MKARPRTLENRIADALNTHFDYLGLSPVERIPVLGRTGPDLTINEMNLVVDVKSRQEVPKELFFPLLVPFRFEDLVAVRISSFLSLLDCECYAAPVDFTSKIVRGYYEHMDKWTRAKKPDGISCVILHRPKMPIGSSVVIIHTTNRRRLFEYAEYRYNHISDDPAE